MTTLTTIEPTFSSESRVFLATAGGRSRNTASAYRSALTYFLRFLEEMQGWTAESPVALLSLDSLIEFPSWLARQKRQRGKNGNMVPLAEGTRQLYLTAATRFLRFMVLRKRLPLVDFTEYERVKEEFSRATNLKGRPVQQKIPGDELVKAVVQAVLIPPRFGPGVTPEERRHLTLGWQRNIAIILALKSSGMRVGELVSLKLGDLDEARQGAWVTGKGRKTRFVAFTDEAWQAIHHYIKQRDDESIEMVIANPPLFCQHNHSMPAGSRFPLTTRTIQALVRDLARQAGIMQRFNFTVHSFRHYFADRLLTFTGNLALVQEALGHADPKTTRVYTQIRPEQIADSVRGWSERPYQQEGAL